MSEKPKQSRFAISCLRVPLFALLVLVLGAGVALAESSLSNPHYRQVRFAGGSVARIYPPDYVRAHFMVFSEGSARLDFPSLDSVEMMLPDSEGGDCGFDVFYPHRIDDVIAALESVSYPRPVESLEILLLPYPRLYQTSSSAIGKLVFLSPGVHSIPEEVTHMVTTHELGHVFHNSNMPNETGKHWSEYRLIRGIEDEIVYCASASHRNRPHEIFAEDFRYLFGGALANYSGSIENADLPLPDQVPGLRNFFIFVTTGRSLVPALAQNTLQTSNFPNPFNPSTRITISAKAAQLGSPLSVEIFDARGRRVRSLHRGELGNLQMQFQWDGRDEHGNEMPSGVYFTRILLGTQQFSHKMILVS